MASIAETLSNGLTEGIKPIIAESDLDKRQQLIKDLAARQALLVDAKVQESADGTKQQLLLAELSQGSAFTRNARPAVVYAGLLFIFTVHVLIPVLAFLQDKKDPSYSLPTEFWWAWSGVVSMWVVGRSYEKVNTPTSLSSAITGTAR